MPSASNNVKVEKQQLSNANAAEIVENNKVGLDSTSAIGQVYNLIAHKIRNLEKRKVSKPNGEFGSSRSECVFSIIAEITAFYFICIYTDQAPTCKQRIFHLFIM